MLYSVLVSVMEEARAYRGGNVACHHYLCHFLRIPEFENNEGFPDEAKIPCMVPLF